MRYLSSIHLTRGSCQLAVSSRVSFLICIDISITFGTLVFHCSALQLVVQIKERMRNCSTYSIDSLTDCIVTVYENPKIHMGGEGVCTLKRNI